ncbi:acyl-CoA thioesterase [Herbinix luporum]|jgi:acyl-CoA hydrolase|uniref:acyl-CoA thioesterase n=1 Tax=Herbinix luporum TaxID=1679721 RepID=UPI0017666EA1|nr:acyl-CoA thioesterase [Herbinix luporum]HHT56502.1 acyl-CoA thioesterase [Herbinix luporum]
MKAKRVSESVTEQVHIIMPSHISGTDRLFGGQLLAWIDEVSAVTARRHSGRNVTTAAIDNLQFKAGVYINNILVLIGRVTYVGKTSMEVRVDTYVEDHLSGIRKVVNRAYLVMVALDDEEKPTEVPGLILETEAERAEWEAGLRRRELRSKRRKEGY